MERVPSGTRLTGGAENAKPFSEAAEHPPVTHNQRQRACATLAQPRRAAVGVLPLTERLTRHDAASSALSFTAAARSVSRLRTNVNRRYLPPRSGSARAAAPR